jgi:hypothetical protein
MFLQDMVLSLEFPNLAEIIKLIIFRQVGFIFGQDLEGVGK